MTEENPYATTDGFFEVLMDKEDFWYWHVSFEGDWRIEDANGNALTAWYPHPREALAEARLLPESA